MVSATHNLIATSKYLRLQFTSSLHPSCYHLISRVVSIKAATLSSHAHIFFFCVFIFWTTLLFDVEELFCRPGVCLPVVASACHLVRLPQLSLVRLCSSPNAPLCGVHPHDSLLAPLLSPFLAYCCTVRRRVCRGESESKQVGLNLQPGNPVTSCRLNSKFAFCVMRNPDEAAKALNLNGIPYLGNVLKMVSAESPYHMYVSILLKYKCSSQ